MPDTSQQPDKNDVEATACFLMTFLDASHPDDSTAIVRLMAQMIPLCHQSYLARQADLAGKHPPE
jgi:hypothetical protein